MLLKLNLGRLDIHGLKGNAIKLRNINRGLGRDVALQLLSCGQIWLNLRRCSATSLPKPRKLVR